MTFNAAAKNVKMQTFKDTISFFIFIYFIFYIFIFTYLYIYIFLIY